MREKSLRTKICKYCNKEYIGHFSSLYCCKDHQKLDSKRIFFEKRKEKNNIKYKNLILNFDYVECPICRYKTVQLNAAHFEHIHHIKFSEIKKQYPNLKLTAENFIKETLCGQNNPNSKTNATEEERRARSPFCKEFYENENEWKNFHEINKDAIKHAINPYQIEYWTNKGFTEKEAEQKIEERKKICSFTLENCIKRYGEIEGTTIFNERQRKWKEKVFNKDSCISKSSSKMAENIINNILEGVPDLSYILYSDLPKKDEKYIWCSEINRGYKYDLTNTQNKHIIEINGDFWHANPKLYKNTWINPATKRSAEEIWKIDDRKIKTAEKYGYSVMIIWESEYNENPEETIKKCREFLFQ